MKKTFLITILLIAIAGWGNASERTDVFIGELKKEFLEGGYAAGLKLLRDATPVNGDGEREEREARFNELTKVFASRLGGFGELLAVEEARRVGEGSQLIAYRVCLAYSNKPLYLDVVVYDNSKTAIVRGLTLNAGVEDELADRLTGDRKVEQGGAGEPATRSESDLEGGDKPQPEAEGRSR